VRSGATRTPFHLQRPEGTKEDGKARLRCGQGEKKKEKNGAIGGAGAYFDKRVMEEKAFCGGIFPGRKEKKGGKEYVIDRILRITEKKREKKSGGLLQAHSEKGEKRGKGGGCLNWY